MNSPKNTLNVTNLIKSEKYFKSKYYEKKPSKNEPNYENDIATVNQDKNIQTEEQTRDLINEHHGFKSRQGQEFFSDK